MKYTLSNVINKPQEIVVEKFKEPEGAMHWMEGLKKIEHVSGTPGKRGAKTNFTFLHKNKEVKIEETILEENLPRQIKFGYVSGGGYNEVELIFEKISDTSTRQTCNTDFQFKGFMKLIGYLFQGMFKKQSLKYMDAFKHYAER